eukprot:UN27765
MLGSSVLIGIISFLYHVLRDINEKYFIRGLFLDCFFITFMFYPCTVIMSTSIIPNKVYHSFITYFMLAVLFCYLFYVSRLNFDIRAIEMLKSTFETDKKEEKSYKSNINSSSESGGGEKKNNPDIYDDYLSRFMKKSGIFYILIGRMWFMFFCVMCVINACFALYLIM